MKINSVFTITIIALLPLAGFAQTPPAPPQPPQPPGPPGMPGHHEKGPKVPVTYLGVETTQVPPVVSEQRGLGKGQEQKLSAKLAKKEVPQRHHLFPGGNRDWHWDFDETGDLGDQMQDLKGQLKEQLGDAQHGIIHGAVMQAHEAARRARDDARRAADELRIFFEDNGAVKASKIDLGKAQIVFSDEKGELNLANVDGRKLLTVKDPHGKLLFSGPVETKEDLDKMPADVRQRYDRLQENDLPTAAPRSDTDNADDADTDDADDQDDDDDEETGESVSQQVSFQSFPREMIPQSISF